MVNLNDYLDNLSLVKVLSFFLLLILVLTLIPLLFNFSLGSLIFKLSLYGIMLLFFIYKFNSISFGDGQSFFKSLKSQYESIFKVSKFYQILFIVLANIFFVTMIYFILRYFSSLGFLQFDSSLFGDFTSSSPLTVIVYFVAIVVLSPIVEELLFRGIFLRRFNKEFNNLNLAIILSSVLFGICHGFGGILGAILFGICVSILYVKSNNILVPIFAHFLNNLISFLLALFGLEYLFFNSISVIVIFILAILTNLVLFRAIFKEWPSSFD
ncbi:CPBP family intramembrane glutamic endopeptidase [uncultured Methanobrevibacter sp.]|uniref:CPBP family intramembrane glutamic endopeptidase n=1 Tax=uncultured Methanobrevibacter sp. TaxID=253161 RepID=UPI00260BDF07